MGNRHPLGKPNERKVRDEWAKIKDRHFVRRTDNYILAYFRYFETKSSVKN
jgi:hypothetical protein